MESINYLEEIRKSNNYEIALLSTFNFDISFFEHFILNSFINNDVRKVTVFVDGKQLSSSLEEVRYSSIGKRYLVKPIRMEGAFHPKLILLLGQTKAKLCVASANLTTSGFCSNNEIVNVFDFDVDHPENLTVITKAIELFEQFNKISCGLEEPIFKEIKSLPYYGKNNRNESLYFLDNMESSILEQLHSILPEVLSVDIAAPYYDNELAVIDEIHNNYPHAKISVFLQNGKSRFPGEKMNDARITVFPFSEVSSNKGEINQKNNHFYHGKVFRFTTVDGDYILYGSANCTRSAMNRSFANGGNIECDILEKGLQNEFDEFFQGFIPDVSPLSVERLAMDEPSNPNIWFKYGELEQDTIYLCFGFNHETDIKKVFVAGQETTYAICEKEIHMSVLADLIQDNSDILDVKFIIGEKTVTIRCWVLQKSILLWNRLPAETSGLSAFDSESVGDKYFQDMTTLLQAMALSVSELEQVESIRQMVNPTQEPETEDEVTDEENGIVDYVPPPADIMRQHDMIKQVEKITWSYRNAFHDWKQKAMNPSSGKEDDHFKNQENAGTPRRVFQNRDKDKAFLRFVKNKCQKVLDDEYVKLVSPKRYLEIVHVFFSIIDKHSIFYKEEKGENNSEEKQEKKGQMEKGPPIKPCEAATIKKSLLTKVTGFVLNDEEVEEYRTLIILTIVINHVLNERVEEKRIDAINKELLYCVDQSEEYRQMGYMLDVDTAVKMLKMEGITMNLLHELSYVDTLFGYKSIANIKQSLREDYGKDSEIMVFDDHIEVAALAKNMKIIMRPQVGSLRDINNYARIKGRFVYFKATIRVDENQTASDPIIDICYEIKKLPSYNVRQTIKRKSGKMENKSLNALSIN